MACSCSTTRDLHRRPQRVLVHGLFFSGASGNEYNLFSDNSTTYGDLYRAQSGVGYLANFGSARSWPGRRLSRPTPLRQPRRRLAQRRTRTLGLGADDHGLWQHRRGHAPATAISLRRPERGRQPAIARPRVSVFPLSTSAPPAWAGRSMLASPSSSSPRPWWKSCRMSKSSSSSTRSGRPTGNR